jgi:hypothetical protein
VGGGRWVKLLEILGHGRQEGEGGAKARWGDVLTVVYLGLMV